MTQGLETSLLIHDTEADRMLTQILRDLVDDLSEEEVADVVLLFGGYDTQYRMRGNGLYAI